MGHHPVHQFIQQLSLLADFLSQPRGLHGHEQTENENQAEQGRVVSFLPPDKQRQGRYCRGVGTWHATVGEEQPRLPPMVHHQGDNHLESLRGQPAGQCQNSGIDHVYAITSGPGMENHASRGGDQTEFISIWAPGKRVTCEIALLIPFYVTVFHVLGSPATCRVNPEVLNPSEGIAMFKLLRSKAKFLYWFIAISFILFMGLTNMGGRGCQSSLQKGPEAGVIGSVNGSKILASEYDQYYRSLLAQMRQQSPTRDLNPNQYATAQQRAWDGLVRSRILDEAISEKKITVADDEVLDRFENNPPPQILANFRNPETGQIDMNSYYAELQNPDNDWTGVENFVRDLIRSEKLQNEVTMGVTVTDEEIREEYLNQTGQATAEYVGALYTEIQDGFTPSDEEINAWYASHQDDYKRPAKARCDVVRYAKEAGDADYAEILQFMNEIREEILSGQKTFETAAAEYSEDGSASRGGDLGVFDRNRMVAPFTEAAFSLPVGELSQPVKTKFGYHLIEVLEQIKDEETGEVLQVKARHILLKVTPGPETLAMISEAAQAFADRVNGSNFVSTAQAEGLDLLAPDPFIMGRDIPGISFSLAGATWAHQAKVGQVSRVFETNDYFYIVLAGGLLPAGTADLEEVRSQVSLAVTRDHQKGIALERLNPVVGQIQMGKSMAEAAAGTDLTYAVSDTFGVNDNINHVGYGTDFNKLAINGQVGQLIAEVETQRGVFALIPTWIKPVDEADFATRQPGLREGLLGRERAQVMEEWLSERESKAEIKDFRRDFR
jgi:peptidyl-prolyl cis-trans isomerase D